MIKFNKENFHKVKNGFLSGFLAIALASLTITSPALAEKNTITIGIEADLARLDPHISTTWNTFKALLHMYEGFVAEDLLAENVETPPIVPSLAESWEISADKKTYTFKLREGVSFHDGEPWNAQAAKFNLDRMTNPDFEFHQPGSVGLLSWVWGDLESYKVVNDFTFEIKLKQPNAEFLRRLSAGGSGTPRMISPAAVRKYGNDGINTNPVGTGPFKFGEREVGVQTVLVKNSGYWDEKRVPKFERLILRGIPEVTTRELGLLTGELDMISTPSPDSLEYLEAQGMTMVKGPVSTIYPIWLNFRGGKGVAAYFGILLIMSPLFSLLFILMWVSTFVTTRYSSLSSITSIFSIPVVYIMVNMMKLNDFIYYDFLSPKDIDFRINFTIILFMSVILIYRHMENIKRLIKGQESKLK